MTIIKSNKFAIILFWLIGIGLCLFGLFLTLASTLFSYDHAVRDMPIRELVFVMFLAGVLYAGLWFIIRRITSRNIYLSSSLLTLIFLVGFFMRAILVFSDPVLEDDWQRYLWDGGVIVAGENPYKYSPSQVIDGESPKTLRELGFEAPLVLERINHPHLRTIYPIGSEALFAINHLIAPFSLTSWRFLILLSEIISFGILVLLLRHLSRPPIWITLYWWNPLVVKELLNSAHMEGVLVPFVVAGIYFYMRKRFHFAHVSLWVAASIKIWPALLLPFIWWQFRSDFKNLILAGFISTGFMLLIAAPFIASGIDETSGLVAYSLKWSTNSALFPMIEGVVQFLTSLFGGGAKIAALGARALVGLFLVSMIAFVIIRFQKSREPLLWPVFFICALVFLFNPAQFPWYFVWIAPFLPFFPSLGFVVLVPMMAFYYLGFYLYSHGLYHEAKLLLSFLIWVPVWSIVGTELYRCREVFYARG